MNGYGKRNIKNYDSQIFYYILKSNQHNGTDK